MTVTRACDALNMHSTTNMKAMNAIVNLIHVLQWRSVTILYDEEVSYQGKCLAGNNNFGSLIRIHELKFGYPGVFICNLQCNWFCNTFFITVFTMKVEI